MEIYTSEEEQIAALKRWWKSNGQAVISGVLIALVAIVGWNLWQSHQKDKALQASVLYQQLVAAVNAQKYDSVEKLSERLRKEYDGTPYAGYAALLQAKALVEQDDLPEARATLQEAVGQVPGELEHVVNLRLVRLLLASGEYEQGLQLIAEKAPGSSENFAPLYEELKGDLYVALDRPGEARTAYQQALRGGAVMPLLQFKLDDLTAPEIVESVE